jgi:3-oxoacyl-[acyl-carrier-protein] synthase III
MRAFIKAIDYYLPEKVVTNEALVNEFPEWSVEKIVSKVGINKRHVASEEETASDLAVKAAEALFKKENIDKSEIDFVLFCTQSPDYFLPTSACLIQSRLGLPTSCGAMDFNLGCSGYVYGLSVAKGLICGGIAKNILLLTGDTYSKRIHNRDKGNRTIFGDAATATLISSEGIAEILNFSLGTDGKGGGNLIIKTGANRQPCMANDTVFDENNNPVSSDHLYMDGGEIFSFTLEAVPALTNKTLEKNNLSKEDISLFVFHQANKYMLDVLKKKIKIDDDKFYYYLSEVGNTVSSTIPIALTEAKKENRFHGNVLIEGFGVGYSWAGAVLKAH